MEERYQLLSLENHRNKIVNYMNVHRLDEKYFYEIDTYIIKNFFNLYPSFKFFDEKIITMETTQNIYHLTSKIILKCLINTEIYPIYSSTKHRHY